MAKNLELDLIKIDIFIDRFMKLRKATDLLQRIWTWIGPYDEKKILKHDEKLLKDLREFFDFDDSE